MSVHTFCRTIWHHVSNTLNPDSSIRSETWSDERSDPRHACVSLPVDTSLGKRTRVVKQSRAARLSLLFHVHTSPRTNGSDAHQEQLCKHTSWLMGTNWMIRRARHHVLTQASQQFVHHTVWISAPNLFNVWTTTPSTGDANCFYHPTFTLLLPSGGSV